MRSKILVSLNVPGPILPSAPQISIVIPTYSSRPRDIKRALESVAGQTFSDFEVIVVDDGSPTAVDSYLSGIGAARLKLLRHAENRGAAAARNTGIQAAAGEWVAFLDADDTWQPDKLERQLETLRQAPSNVLACATGYRLHKDGRTITISLHLSPDRFRRDILFGCTISPGSTLFVKRSVFDKVGMFDEGLRRLEDWDWLLRFSRHHDMAFIAEPLAEIYLETSREVYLSRKADPVVEAVHFIRRKHLPLLTTRADRTRLRNALLVESAAHMYRIGRPFRAVGYVIAAFFIYPFRNTEFFRTLLQSLVSVVRRKLRN